MKVVTTCRLPVVKETDLCVLSHFRHVWFFATLWTSSLPHSSVHGILQATVLVWVAMPFSRRSSQPRDWTLGLLHCRPFLYRWATGEAQRKPGEIYIHIICMYFYIYIIYSHIYMSFHKVKKYGGMMNSSCKHGLPDRGGRMLMWKREGRERRMKSKPTKKNGWKPATNSVCIYIYICFFFQLLNLCLQEFRCSSM